MQFKYNAFISSPQLRRNMIMNKVKQEKKLIYI